MKLARFPLMALALLALLAAMWAGLLRLGWPLPLLHPAWNVAHGPLMVSGFLGALIGLERAVALDRRWAYAAPLLNVLGALALVIGAPGFWGPLLMTLGSLGLVAIFAVIVRRQLAPFTVTMALGALAWAAGNGLWLTGQPIYRAVPWWIGFLVLTIAGERLELGQILRLSRWVQNLFVGIMVVLLGGLGLAGVSLEPGMRLTGAGLLALAVWLLRYDIARRTAQKPGLTRFIAACMLSGYAWLGVGGLFALAFGGATAGPRYDALLHAIFLGFVFSMIFGHAPIILPAVLKAPIAFQPAFYVHVGLLHFSLLLRVVGDLAGWPAGRQWGGMINVIALLAFMFTTGRAVRKATGRA